MLCRIVFTAGLLLSAAYGQNQTTNQSTVPAPANEPFGAPIITTPTASFPTQAPSAGISDVGRAGASSETPMLPPEASMGSTGGTTVGIASSGVSPTESVSPTGSASSTGAVSSAGSRELGPANDLSPSVFVGESSVSGGGAVSLAEIANRFKAEKGTHNARVLSNEDAQKLGQNSGVTMAKNMPPLGPGTLEQGGQQPNGENQPTSSQPATQNTQNASATAAQNSGSSQSGAQPASSASQPTNGASASANATTPQIQNQQSNDTQGSSRLPATATFLPLIGLLGLASAGIGLLFRKFRK